MSALTEGVGAAVRRVLLDDPAVAALVGQRVYPSVRESEVLPAIVYEITESAADAPDLGFGGAAQSAVVGLALHCFSSTQDGADGLAGAVELAVDGYVGWPGGAPPRLHISVVGRVDSAYSSSDTAAGDLERQATLRVAVRRF